jgi:photosystem II stability/assembly factor-like uncharacterized protein
MKHGHDAAQRRISLVRTLLCGAALVCNGVAVADETAAAAAAPASAPAAASAWHDPVDLPAEVQPQASHAVLMDMVEAGTIAIAVGERGTVLTSSDRTHWEQIANVPTRATLTAVAAVGNKAWAVGHDGVILASSDAGQHWTLQRKDPWQPPADGAAVDPRQGMPLLDVLFLDESMGFAVGAYSQLLTTRDGGATWTAQVVHDSAAAPGAGPTGSSSGTFSKEQLAIGDEADPHFNAIARTGDGSLFIAGERGAAFRSRDRGQSWQHLKWPYNGSMFGVIGFEGQHVLAFGLRGHAFESDDLGDHWNEVKTGTELSLMGGSALPGGGAALVGANGLVLLRRSPGEAFKSGTMTPSGVLAAVLQAEGGGAFTVAGENGVGRYQPK